MVGEAAAVSAIHPGLCAQAHKGGWIVGNKGFVFRSTDGGQSWKFIDSGTTEDLESVHFADQNAGMAVGGYSTPKVIRTTDGGLHWQDCTPSGLYQYTGLRSVHMLDSMVAWIVGDYGTVLRTSDGGETWTVWEQQIESGLRHVHFVDADTGWLVGSDGAIKKWDPAAKREAILFPQYAIGETSGGRYLTRLILTNSGGDPAAGRVHFQDPGGNPQAVPMSGQAVNFVDCKVPAWGAADVRSDGTGQLLTGAAELTSIANGRLYATEVFEGFGKYVSVDNAVAGPAHQVYVSRDITENTGIAVYNPGNAAIRLRLFLVDFRGSERAATVLDLAARQQLARFVDETELFKPFFDATTGTFKGTLNIRVDDGKKVAVLGLLQKRQSGALIAVAGSPTTYGAATAPGNLSPSLGKLVFPHFAVGLSGEIRYITRIVLRNNSRNSDVGSILFRDNNGNPISVSIGGQAVNKLDYSLPAWGSSDFEATGMGALATGSVELVSSLATASGIEGTEIFEASGNFVSVQNSIPRSSHQLFVSLNTVENTGIAVFNPNAQTVSLRLALLDKQGAMKASKELQLLPGQKIARFVNETDLFRGFFDANKGDFIGTLHIREQDVRGVALISLLQADQSGALIAVSTRSSVYTR